MFLENKQNYNRRSGQIKKLKDRNLVHNPLKQGNKCCPSPNQNLPLILTRRYVLICVLTVNQNKCLPQMWNNFLSISSHQTFHSISVLMYTEYLKVIMILENQKESKDVILYPIFLYVQFHKTLGQIINVIWVAGDNA